MFYLTEEPIAVAYTRLSHQNTAYTATAIGATEMHFNPGIDVLVETAGNCSYVGVTFCSS